jgi:hypothetical protein
MTRVVWNDRESGSGMKMGEGEEQKKTPIHAVVSPVKSLHEVDAVQSQGRQSARRDGGQWEGTRVAKEALGALENRENQGRSP